MNRLIASLLVAVGCGGGGGGSYALMGGSNKMAEASNPIRIGIPTLYRGSQFHAALVDEAEKVASSLGAKVVVVDSVGDRGRQESAVRGFIRDGMSAILLSPLSESLIPAIEDAVKAGVPVAIVDARMKTDKVLVQVVTDNVQGGRAAAEFIIERLGNRGSVIELEGNPEQVAARDRKVGFDEAIRSSSVKLIASQVANWDRRSALNVMRGLIKKHPDFDAVFAANDEMILGAIDAMSSAHVDPASKVTVGFDATRDAFNYLRSGKLSGTVDQHGALQAAKAVEYLVDFIKNGTRPPEQVIVVPCEVLTRAP